MASEKKKAAARTAVRFRDLKSKKNPKGGAFDAYLKIDTNIKLQDSSSPTLTKI